MRPSPLALLGAATLSLFAGGASAQVHYFEDGRPWKNQARNGPDAEVLLVPLHGSLSLDKQQRAIAPAPAGKRKVSNTFFMYTGSFGEGTRTMASVERRLVKAVVCACAASMACNMASPDRTSVGPCS